MSTVKPAPSDYKQLLPSGLQISPEEEAHARKFKNIGFVATHFVQEFKAAFLISLFTCAFFGNPMANFASLFVIMATLHYLVLIWFKGCALQPMLIIIPWIRSFSGKMELEHSEKVMSVMYLFSLIGQALGAYCGVLVMYLFSGVTNDSMGRTEAKVSSDSNIDSIGTVTASALGNNTVVDLTIEGAKMLQMLHPPQAESEHTAAAFAFLGSVLIFYCVIQLQRFQCRNLCQPETRLKAAKEFDEDLKAGVFNGKDQYCKSVDEALRRNALQRILDAEKDQRANYNSSAQVLAIVYGLVTSLLFDQTGGITNPWTTLAAGSFAGMPLFVLSWQVAWNAGAVLPELTLICFQWLYGKFMLPHERLAQKRELQQVNIATMHQNAMDDDLNLSDDDHGTNAHKP